MHPDLQELGTDCERDLEIAKSLGATIGTFSPCKIKKNSQGQWQAAVRVDAGITTCWVTLIFKRLRSTREKELSCFLKLYANVEHTVLKESWRDRSQMSVSRLHHIFRAARQPN